LLEDTSRKGYAVRGALIGCLLAVFFWFVPVPVAALVWLFDSRGPFGDYMLAAIPGFLALPLLGALIGLVVCATLTFMALLLTQFMRQPSRAWSRPRRSPPSSGSNRRYQLAVLVRADAAIGGYGARASKLAKGERSARPKLSCTAGYAIR
jgi:hypothetical protein